MRKILQTPFEIRRPFRLWMTGSIAVMMAAMLPIRDVSQAERNHLMRLLRHSHFGVRETVQRLEASARAQGLPVFALLHGERPVLVLASSGGGTPVVMQNADSPPAMPLSLMVREARAGGADVLVTASDWPGLPPGVADELAALPGLVERALA